MNIDCIVAALNLAKTTSRGLGLWIEANTDSGNTIILMYLYYNHDYILVPCVYIPNVKMY